MIVHMLFDPFIDFSYMRRSMVACCALSISLTPIGGFLMLKKMSLIGDALSHSILPGVVIGYCFSGISFVPMIIGGFLSSLIVAILSNWISEKTTLQKDASYSGFCLGSLACGVLLMSFHESDLNLLDLLFGSILSVSIVHVKFIGIISTITVISLAIFYRVLIIESFDPDFLKINSIIIFNVIQIFFLLVVVLNLIASFRITGTLMSVGLMMLPNLSARYWTKNLVNFLLLSVCIAVFSAWIGLLGSFYLSFPAGPTIVLCGSIFFLISVLFGKNQGILFFLYKNIKYNN